jgi:hypothetical protein
VLLLLLLVLLLVEGSGCITCFLIKGWAASFLVFLPSLYWVLFHSYVLRFRYYSLCSAGHFPCGGAMRQSLI